MFRKLTLRLEEEVIMKAREYAKKNKTSISELVSQHLKSISMEGVKEGIDPRVAEISGIIPDLGNTDHRARVQTGLQEKYGKEQ